MNLLIQRDATYVPQQIPIFNPWNERQFYFAQSMFSVENGNFFRPAGNSPSVWHLTHISLLCIFCCFHHSTYPVKRKAMKKKNIFCE